MKFQTAILLGLVKVLWIFLIPLTAASPSKDSLIPKIINGTEALPENTRHQVSVRKKSWETIFGVGHICGGSLIKPSIVLSAAHCFYDDDELKFHSETDYFVVMGTLNRFEKNEYTVQLEISKILYPNFDRPTYKNDLALMFLSGMVPETNPAVSVIKMNKEPIPVGTVCQVTGWGIMETGDTAMNLMSLDVPIIDNKTCSLGYGNGNIKDGMICAGYMEGEKDSCNGDSGGPLVHNGVLVGVVSFGFGCAKPGYPGVYTDVRRYVTWVEDNLKSGARITSVNVVFLLLSLIATRFFVS